MTTIRRDENGQVDEIVSGDTHSAHTTTACGWTVYRTFVREDPKPIVTHVDDHTAIIEAGTRVYVYARIRKGKAWLQIIEEDKQ